MSLDDSSEEDGSFRPNIARYQTVSKLMTERREKQKINIHQNIRINWLSVRIFFCLFLLIHNHFYIVIRHLLSFYIRAHRNMNFN